MKLLAKKYEKEWEESGFQIEIEPVESEKYPIRSGILPRSFRQSIGGAKKKKAVKRTKGSKRRITALDVDDEDDDYAPKYGKRQKTVAGKRKV